MTTLFTAVCQTVGKLLDTVGADKVMTDFRIEVGLHKLSFKRREMIICISSIKFGFCVTKFIVSFIPLSFLDEYYCLFVRLRSTHNIFIILFLKSEG